MSAARRVSITITAALLAAMSQMVACSSTAVPAGPSGSGPQGSESATPDPSAEPTTDPTVLAELQERYKCRFLPESLVEIDGNFYSPLWGPMRSDILRTEAFADPIA